MTQAKNYHHCKQDMISQLIDSGWPVNTVARAFNFDPRTVNRYVYASRDRKLAYSPLHRFLDERQKTFNLCECFHHD